MPSSLPVPIPAGRRRMRGFTMVEILTATAIMVVVITVVMTILSQVLTAWNDSTDLLTLSGLARQALDTINADLQTAIFKRDGGQWLYLNTQDSNTNSPVPSAQFSRLIFFSASPLHQSRGDGSPGQTGQSIFGDICCIEYKVWYADPFGNPSSTQKTFTLHRVVIDPGTTFFGKNWPTISQPGPMGITGGTTNLAKFFDQNIDTGGTVTSTPPVGPNGNTVKVTLYGAQSPVSTLLDNVAGFSVVLSVYGYVPTNTPPLQVYPQYKLWNLDPTSAYEYFFGGGPTVASAGSQLQNTPGYFDTLNINIGSLVTFYGFAYADVSLTLLTDEGVQTLQGYGGHLPENLTWTQFLALYSETYTIRIPFLNTPQ